VRRSHRPLPSLLYLKDRGTYFGGIVMNTTDIAESIAADGGLTKAAAKKLVDGVFATIASAAAKGEEISLPGFGKFTVKERP
jgi:nucleoid DNA-binding protein